GRGTWWITSCRLRAAARTLQATCSGNRRRRGRPRTRSSDGAAEDETPPTPSPGAASRQDCVALCFKELQSLSHERFVVLEDAPMPGILIEDELGVRKAARQVDRVAAGHHPVVITIRHQNRVMNARQIGGTLTPPGAYGFQLRIERRDPNRLVAILGALFQSCQELARRLAAVPGLGEEEIVLRVPEGQHALDHVANGQRR